MGGIGSTGRRHESSWMECGARGAGPGQEAQAGETGWPSRPGGSHWRGLGNYNRTVLPFKKGQVPSRNVEDGLEEYKTRRGENSGSSPSRQRVSVATDKKRHRN